MIVQYTLRLRPDRRDRLRPETAYRLYASLLAAAGDEDFGASAHESAVTPVSQYLRLGAGDPLWTVTLLGGRAEEALAPAAEGTDRFYIESDRTTLTVADRRVRRIGGAEELFALGAELSGRTRLDFLTPAVFRSRGDYVRLPDTRLILQSLVKKWNGSFPDCPIEDEDGEGVEALARGLRLWDFRLRGAAYHLKGNRVPGFLGTVWLENRLAGFHRELASALLAFAPFAGVGAKTTLGMGGAAVAPAEKVVYHD